MKVSRVSMALVCSVFLAAAGASAGSSNAATSQELTSAGYQALTTGDANKSVDLFTQAIAAQQLSADALANAYLNRALAYQKLGKDQNAVDDYTSALNLDAMSSDIRARALYNRGLAQERVGNSVLAIEDYTSSLLINANFSQSYLARANALRGSGQYLFSISDYERAIKNGHPQPAVVYFGEAQAYEALKRPVEAKQLLQAAVAADPSFSPAQDKLKNFSDVAELDDATADPIMTGSITSPTNQTQVAMLSLPKAVEPPHDMIAEADHATDVAAADAADQIADAAEGMAPQPAKFGRVEVAEIPVIPANAPGAKPAKNQVAMAVPVPGEVPVAAAKTPAKKAIAAPAPVQTAMATTNDADGITDTDPIATASTDQVAAPAAAPAAPLSGWAVQVSSAASESAAWSAWKAMQNSHAVLAGENASVVKADLGAKGTFYRVRLGGYEDQAAAQKACGRMKAGGITCFVAKATS
jgi:tetratricopeptide (TPR) repeat protein